MLDNIKLVRKNIKYANIKVRPNLEVLFTAPIKMSMNDIDIIINKRTPWIHKQLEHFKQIKPTPQKEFVSGESVEYLGHTYRLKVIKSTVNRIKLKHGYLFLFVSDTNNLKLKQLLLENWYSLNAQEYFNSIINKFQPIVKKSINKIVIKKMKTRWGSCSTVKGFINLNLDLIKKPRYAIEYVILHELVHLIHYNHDKNFYNFLSSHMPDWQIRRSRLNTPV
ncbi:MAG TPA: SprT family zinc-dependent metalloprotease [Aquella sp.]|nr:SprT family zinc-dependent metalloprotease [Aquella sp.]